MNFDLLSFLFGAATGVVFLVLVNYVRNFIPKIKNILIQVSSSWNERNSIGIENQILNNALDRAQKAHLSGVIFPLDEIVIPPLIIAPQKSELNNQSFPPDSPTDNLLPHLPDFPELISQFPINKLTIIDAIKNGVNCFLIGPTGSGKTIALAYLVSQIVKDRGKDSIFENSIPIYAHANDINIISSGELNPLSILIDITAEFLPSIKKDRLSEFVEKSWKENKFLLVLDGMDELAPELFDQCSDFLQKCIDLYPQIQIITTTTPDYFGNLLKLHFTPYTLASWHHEKIQQFINKWKNAWVANEMETNQDTLNDVDNVYSLIISWILLNNNFRTPFEWTLLLWSSFCGDLNGPTTLHALESYIQRSAKNVIPRSTLENIAYTMVMNQETCLQYNQIEKIISKHSPKEISSDRLEFLDSDNISEEVEKGKKSKKERRISSRSRVITKLLETGFFIEHQHELITFGNPIVAGYLASHFNDSYEYEYAEDDRWSGKLEMLRFLAAQNKISPIAYNLLAKDKGPHHLELLMVSRWLNTPLTKQVWRSKVMEKMGRVLLAPDTSRSLRLKIITAFLISNEPTVDILLEQLIGMQNPDIKIAAALGCSVRSSNKNSTQLMSLLEDKVYEVQLAGVLALCLQENSTAKLVTDEILKTGEEDHRVVVAESLSNKGQEGRIKLLDLLKDQDLLSRRAALAGLAKNLDDQSKEEIEKVLQQDSQWVIRNIAAQIIEAVDNPYHALAAEPLPESSDSPWLIAYAGNLGIGISPGIPPLEALIHSVQNGEIEEQIAAMDYIRTIGDPETRGLYLNLIGKEPRKLSENADLNLWYLSKSIR